MTPSEQPERGDAVVESDGYTYLPRFFSAADAEELGAFFAGLSPIWEKRYADDSRRRGGEGRLTRPVYWLGGWQFAALGYYAEPDHRVDRVVRAEPFPPVMDRILARLQPRIVAAGGPEHPPNTCLINYYGHTTPEDGPPVDQARLRMHRDREPHPVVMFSVGQPAQFELVDLDAEAVAHSQWLRHRSVVVLAGNAKDALYHRVTRVRYGQQPALSAQIAGFAIRRVSVSFRYVPDEYIVDLADLPDAAQQIAVPYARELARQSDHWRAQLEGIQASGPAHTTRS